MTDNDQDLRITDDLLPRKHTDAPLCLYFSRCSLSPESSGLITPRLVPEPGKFLNTEFVEAVIWSCADNATL